MKLFLSLPPSPNLERRIRFIVCAAFSLIEALFCPFFPRWKASRVRIRIPEMDGRITQTIESQLIGRDFCANNFSMLLASRLPLAFHSDWFHFDDELFSNKTCLSESLLFHRRFPGVLVQLIYIQLGNFQSGGREKNFCNCIAMKKAGAHCFPADWRRRRGVELLIAFT